MKIKYCLLALCLLFSLVGNAQKILMKGPAPIPVAGEEVTALSFQISAPFEPTLGGGGGIGKATPNELQVKKKTGPSTPEFLKKMVTGNTYDYLKFEYYDNTDFNYYTITLGSEGVLADKGVFITDLRWLSPECPTCLSLDQQVGFRFVSITMEDKPNKGIPIKVTYNAVTNIIK
jgi:type VI protein secretion system component Hcp